MNPISKKKLTQMGLTDSYDIAVAANSEILIVHFKRAVEYDASWDACTPEGEIDFTVHGNARDATALKRVMDWANENILSLSTEWERDPYGGYHPRGTIAVAVDIARNNPVTVSSRLMQNRNQ